MPGGKRVKSGKNHGAHTQKKLNKKKWGRSAPSEKGENDGEQGFRERHYTAKLILDKVAENAIVDILMGFRETADDLDQLSESSSSDESSDSDSSEKNENEFEDSGSSNTAPGGAEILPPPPARAAPRESVPLPDRGTPSHNMRTKFVNEIKMQDRADGAIEAKKRAGSSAQAGRKLSTEGPTPLPRAASGGSVTESVRINFCGEKKDGTPNVGDHKVVVLQRSVGIEGALKTASGKLKSKKKGKALGLVGEQGTVVQWLEDLSLVRDGDMLMLSTAGVSINRGRVPEDAPQRTHVEEEKVEEQSIDEVTHPEQEEELVKKEMSAMAAVHRLKEAYKQGNTSRAREPETVEDTRKASENLTRAATQLKTNPRYAGVLRQRTALPMWERRDEILELIEDNQAIVLTGETGSGKTTQVPQFILEEAVEEGRGGEINIICTQPRRISAIGVSKRVAEERCETVGGVVGYSIRLDSRVSSATRITYCTTGILLRRLVLNPNLTGTTHVILDEVHERTLETDYLLIVLKRLMLLRPDMKVILMSATLQAQLFSDYLCGCPVVSVEGRMFPVEVRTLGQIYRKVGKTPPSKPSNTSAATQAAGGTLPVPGALSPKCVDPIDCELIASLVGAIITDEAKNAKKKGNTNEKGELGAVLVFMPGIQDITKLASMLRRDPSCSSTCWILPLHSSLSPEEQSAVFRPAQPGYRKIVVATNIAETSITIDDCTHVIDTGRVKEMRYDPATGMASLIEVWTSQASARQRAGRAGRVRAGTCWRMYESAFHDTMMPVYTLPEMLRTPLEELILQTLVLELGDPAILLAEAVEPPPESMLNIAFHNLLELQAIDMDKFTGEPRLTPLGYHLAHLPLDARLGKLLIMGALFKCLDPILTIAAALSSRSPFINPRGGEGMKLAASAHAVFSQNKSDALACVEAYNAWDERRNSNAAYEVRRWCREVAYLSESTLSLMDGLRDQFRAQLAEVGFADTQAEGQRGRRNADSVNAGNVRLLESVLCAGLYPHIGWFIRPGTGGGGTGPPASKGGHFALSDTTEAAFVHPSSVNFTRFSTAAATGRQVWIAYHGKMKTTRVYLHNTTFITPFSLLLWGAKVKHLRGAEETGSKRKSDRGTIIVSIDNWMRFKTSETVGVVFKQLRKEINDILVSKIESAGARIESDRAGLGGSSDVVDAVIRLLDIEAESNARNNR